MTTPFGAPSGPYVIGDLDGIEVAFLPRHGPGHVLLPTEVNYRANIFGMKLLGVEWIIGVSAVGSLKAEIVPGHVVLVDQFIDRTFHREHTFFGDGIVGHVSAAHPICEKLRSYLEESCKENGATFHSKGVYVNMEGPAFSTIAESNMYRSWGADVIGMTCITEAKLAREAEISYAILAMATDYDCWHPDHDNVTVEAVVAVLNKNVHVSQSIVRSCVKRLAAHTGPCPQASALANCIMTAPDKMNKETVKKLQPIIGKYFPAEKGPKCMFANSFSVFAILSAAIFIAASQLRK